MIQFLKDHGYVIVMVAAAAYALWHRWAVPLLDLIHLPIPRPLPKPLPVPIPVPEPPPQPEPEPMPPYIPDPEPEPEPEPMPPPEPTEKDARMYAFKALLELKDHANDLIADETKRKEAVAGLEAYATGMMTEKK